MHICILSQFYPPEIGAAAVRLSRLARLMAADGHSVTVLTGMPNYPDGVIPPRYRRHIFFRETLDGVDVRRVWVYASPSKGTRARLLNQGTFMLMAALRGTFLPQPDVILVESHPLFVCLAGGWLKRTRHTRVVLNVSDLWPESAIATGALRPDSTLVKFAERVERWAYADAAHIVGMTEGVVAGILNVHNQPARVSLIANAVDLDRFRPGSNEARAAMRGRFGVGARFTVLHVGNMSLTYDFDAMLDAAEVLSDMAFVFVGGGSQAAHVADQVAARKLSNVTLAGMLPHEAMPGAWAAADACLIALRDHSVASGTRPAKMYEAMAAGVPIVAAIRGEGEQLLRDSGAGIPTPIGDSAALAAALRALADFPERGAVYSAAGRAYAEAHLSPERAKAAYLDILRHCASPGEQPK